MWIIKGLGAIIGPLVILFGVYVFLLNRDIERVFSFCDQVQVGFDVRKVAPLAKQLDVGFGYVKDPTSVDRGELGIRSSTENGTWVFAVVSPYTMGERGCFIRHDGKVVLEMSTR